MRIVNDGGIQT
ncbi:hypothetical protein YPPY95_2264, partial [Yersinia pestis PY-95]